jgi:glycosyltransferase involved in cell wall biosynthesis
MTLAKPRITIAIPARNRLPLLKRAIESALAQSFGDFELIVSDNASSDDVAGLVSSFADARCRVIRHSENIGMARNWHASLSAGTAPLIAWLHDDDYWERDHLALACSAFDKYPQASLYTTAVEHFFETSPAFIQRPAGLPENVGPVWLPSEQALLYWLQRHNAQCSCMVMRREMLQGLDWGPAGLLCQLDYFIAAQLAMRGGWIYNPQIMVHYRAHEPNDRRRLELSTYFRRQKCQAIYIVRRLCEMALDRGLWREQQIVAVADSWTREQHLGLALAAGSLLAPSQVRHTARLLCQRAVEGKHWRDLSGQGRMLFIGGRVYAACAEILSFCRQRWFPRGSQLL